MVYIFYIIDIVKELKHYGGNEESLFIKHSQTITFFKPQLPARAPHQIE